MKGCNLQNPVTKKDNLQLICCVQRGQRNPQIGRETNGKGTKTVKFELENEEYDSMEEGEENDEEEEPHTPILRRSS